MIRSIPIMLLNGRKKKIFQFGRPNITRASVITNPMQNLNVVATTETENVNELATHGDYFYVGGDTATYEFDFSTKVANSVAECPLRLFFSIMNTIQNPSNITGNINTGFSEVINQADLDKLKSTDNVNVVGSPFGVGNISQLMAELDLSPLFAKLGLTNASGKASLKSIQVDAYAKGEGSNAGVLTNGVEVQLRNSAMNVWGSTVGQTYGNNGTNAITKISFSKSATMQDYLDANNKLFVILHSNYASDGTIASKVELDYIKITVQLSRIPDTVQPKSVNLPKYWGMLGSFVPCFDTNSPNVERDIVSIKNGNTNIEIYSQSSAKNLNVYSEVDGANASITGYDLKLNPKYKSVKFLFQQKNGGADLFVLPNNDTTKKYSSTVLKTISGLSQLYLGQYFANNYRAESFMESFTLFDLTSRPTGLSDAEAEVLLRGIPYPSTDELVVNGGFDNAGTGWTVGSGAWAFGTGKAVLTANASGQSISQYIPVLPNSQYTLKCDALGVDHMIEVQDYKDLSTYLRNSGTLYAGETTKIITTGADANYLRFKLRNNTATTGTYIFDNISLKYIKPSPAITPVVNRELFDISKVTLHANARLVGNKIVLDATAGLQYSILDIPVLPNNRYEFKGISGGANSRLRIDELYNGIGVNATTCFISDSTSFSTTFTTKPNANKVRINIYSSVAGHFEFSDISLKLKM